jgi:electron transfer flavoprotein alpha subunit
LVTRSDADGRGVGKEKDIWVVLEADGNKLKRLSLSLVEEGRRLADKLCGDLTALFLGEGPRDIALLAGRHGADRLYLVRHPVLTDERPEMYERVLTPLVEMKKPYLLMAAATPFGSDLLPRISARIKAPLVTNCIEVGVDNELEFVKPVQKGRLHATVGCRATETCMVTVLPDALVPASVPPPTRAVETVSIEPCIDTKGVSIRKTGFIKADHRTIDIADAETIVAVGRGIGQGKNLEGIRAFADRIGAAIGGTRPMVDASILPYERQIGQTGRRVAPKLIFLCGISGAMEFIKGIEKGGTTVAINNDPDAPVFRRADIGILGDVNEVISRATTWFCRQKSPGTGKHLGSEPNRGPCL